MSEPGVDGSFGQANHSVFETLVVLCEPTGAVRNPGGPYLKR